MEGEFKQCKVKIVAQLPWQHRALGGQSPRLLTLPRLPGPLLKTISLLVSSCHFFIHSLVSFSLPQFILILPCQVSHFNAVFFVTALCVFACRCCSVLVPSWCCSECLMNVFSMDFQSKQINFTSWGQNVIIGS